MQVAHMPEGSNHEESLTQANQSCLANLHCQNTVPDSGFLQTLTVGKRLLLYIITKPALPVSVYLINNGVV